MSFSITGVASLNVTSVPQLLPPLIHNEDPLRYNAGPYIELAFSYRLRWYTLQQT